MDKPIDLTKSPPPPAEQHNQPNRNQHIPIEIFDSPPPRPAKAAHTGQVHYAAAAGRPKAVNPVKFEQQQGAADRPDPGIPFQPHGNLRDAGPWMAGLGGVGLAEQLQRHACRGNIIVINNYGAAGSDFGTAASAGRRSSDLGGFGMGGSADRVQPAEGPSSDMYDTCRGKSISLVIDMKGSKLDTSAFVAATGSPVFRDNNVEQFGPPVFNQDTLLPSADPSLIP